MKILVVTQYFWPETFRINELVEMLVAQGNQVTVLTGVPNYPSGSVFPEYKENPSAFIQLEGADVKRVPMMSRGTGSFRLALNYLSFALAASTIGPWLLRGKEYDAIFTYEPSPITVGIPALVLRKLKGAKNCLWVLDLWPETPSALGLLKFQPLFKATEYLVKFIYKHTDLILIQSPGFIDSIRKYAPEKTRVEYFPSWADAVFDTQSTKLAPEIQKSHDVFTILFAGNVGEAQDFESILSAAELLKKKNNKIRFFVLGDGRRTDWVKEEIERRDLSNIITMLGRFPIQRMPEFFNHADALLVSLQSNPVFAATIPAKVQAYMAAGLPILALLDGEGADAIKRWNCGIVANSGNSQGLAAAIMELAGATVAQRREMGANGRKGVDAEFNRDKLVNDLLGWLAEMQVRM